MDEGLKNSNSSMKSSSILKFWFSTRRPLQFTAFFKSFSRVSALNTVLDSFRSSIISLYIVKRDES